VVVDYAGLQYSTAGWDDVCDDVCMGGRMGGSIYMGCAATVQ